MSGMDEKKKNLIGVVLLLFFLTFLIYGSHTQEADIVLKKAVNVCLECIGLGG